MYKVLSYHGEAKFQSGTVEVKKLNKIDQNSNRTDSHIQL